MKGKEVLKVWRAVIQGGSLHKKSFKSDIMESFPAALQLLTIFRIPVTYDLNARVMALSMAWFPIVGFILGCALSLTWFLMNAFFPPAFSSIFVVSLLVILTRGLHLDGLSDTLDGIGGGYTRNKRLEIMKDSHTGAFGVMGIVIAISLKFIAIWQIPIQMKLSALLIFPVMSRFSMVLVAWLSPYARAEGGLGEDYVAMVGSREVLIALIITLAIGVVFLGKWALLLTMVEVFLAFLFSVIFQRILGGVTGDVLGAVNEVGEIAVLAFFLAIPSF